MTTQDYVTQSENPDSRPGSPDRMARVADLLRTFSQDDYHTKDGTVTKVSVLDVATLVATMAGKEAIASHQLAMVRSRKVLNQYSMIARVLKLRRAMHKAWVPFMSTEKSFRMLKDMERCLRLVDEIMRVGRARISRRLDMISDIRYFVYPMLEGRTEEHPIYIILSVTHRYISEMLDNT